MTYRQDLEAAQERIASLEARLAEKDATTAPTESTSPPAGSGSPALLLLQAASVLVVLAHAPPIGFALLSVPLVLALLLRK